MFNINDDKHFFASVFRLLGKQTTKSRSKIYMCNYCQQHFYSKEALKLHAPECSKTISLWPNAKNNILKFKAFQKSMKVPFVVYADFECILKKLESDSNDDLPSTSAAASVEINSNVERMHVPYSFGYYIKCSYDDNLDEFRIYHGNDCATKFVEFLIDDVKRLYTAHLALTKEMKPLTNEERQEFNSNKNCHICEQSIQDEKDKVRDHCHLTGAYRGPAHNKCNLDYKIPTFFPIFLHNFSKYDSHLFIRELISAEGGSIDVIPVNKEVFLSLRKKITVLHKKSKVKLELRFLDSFRFMSSKLEDLAKNLQANQHHIMRKFYNKNFNLLTRKGVFPYDYLDSEQKLQDKQLPPREKFYNSVLFKDCTSEDYSFAQKIWTKFKCKTLKDYLELYLKVDVLLLADIFENFRSLCRGIYKLDPAQYFTTPGLSWDAMLKMTQIELELITDKEMYNFIKYSMRGGLVQCSNRYSRANNKYMKDFNPELSSKYLIYLDANNLYGWAMCNKLPTGDFKWLTTVPSNVDRYQHFLKELNESQYGYILEVDLDYPMEIHDAHNDLPFCPENRVPPEGKQFKLLANLYNKKNYKIHLVNLTQCLKHGLRLIRINRVLQFKQSQWLKKYIDLNNLNRTKARNGFEKDFYKLMNNSVYGKTMENVDKRKNIKIVTKWENEGKRLGARALIASPFFHSMSKLDNDMVIIEMCKTRVFYNKPIYLGFCILELSKWKMYDFHYDYMKPKYSNDHQRICLNYMDTDSLFYTVHTEDFYEDIKTDIEDRFDTSNFAAKNPFKIERCNEKRLGFMKDENGGSIIEEFIGLRSKMYSFKMAAEKSAEQSADPSTKKAIIKVKGVASAYVKTNVKIDHFRRCVLDEKQHIGTVKTIQSKNHKLYTKCFHQRVVLDALDDKRFILRPRPEINVENNLDCIGHTLAWGHFRIELFFCRDTPDN